MKLDQETLSGINEVIENFDSIEEVINSLLPIGDRVTALLFKTGPFFKTVFGSIVMGMADLNIAVFNKYVTNGFSREEALFLMVVTREGLAKGFSNLQQNKKG